MKILVSGLAAALMTTAALAQTPPADPMSSNPAATPPATPAPPAETAPPVATASNAPALVQKDGKWWNGDRKATKEEIAEYKRGNPQ
jgi:hypothetical protein